MATWLRFVLASALGKIYRLILPREELGEGLQADGYSVGYRLPPDVPRDGDPTFEDHEQ